MAVKTMGDGQRYQWLGRVGRLIVDLPGRLLDGLAAAAEGGTPFSTPTPRFRSRAARPRPSCSQNCPARPGFSAAGDGNSQALGGGGGAAAAISTMEGEGQGGSGRRTRLPDRRVSVIETISAPFGAGRQEFTVSVGFWTNGRIGEVFADGHKSGSAMEAVVDDGCVLISMLLQHGVRVSELHGRLSRDDHGGAESILGAICDRLEALETDPEGTKAGEGAA